jgi:hypothetical protein
MSDDPRSGAETPRDPWGNPLPPEDRAPVDPRPEDYPPPFPGDAPGTPGAVPPGYNPAWPPSAKAPGGIPPVPPGVPSQGWGQPDPWAPAKNDGMAVGSLVTGIFALLCGLAGILGIVLGPTAVTLGILARRRVARSNGAVKGEGLATAAIVMGVIGTLISIVYIIVLIRNPSLVDDILNQITTTTTTVPEGNAT